MLRDDNDPDYDALVRRVRAFVQLQALVQKTAAGQPRVNLTRC